ncbi:hypothetical protein NDU88_007364 [Pleurodeles waltl]|uniref:Uncharacterized protein n=1 Tax=Pleurodeles waltl TaxID=8319 RepID=A0AAV7TZJ8_PLEWA|nr:hypothetical protein NDU88_007364 [Pleurodeles waltl]
MTLALWRFLGDIDYVGDRPPPSGESDHSALAQGIPHLGLPSQAQFKACRGRQVESHQHQRPELSRSGSPWTRGALRQDTRRHTSSITVVATSGAGPVRQDAHYRPSPAVGHCAEYRGPLPTRFGRRALPGSSSTLKEVLKSAASLCLTPGPSAVRRYSVPRLACSSRGHPGILISPDAAGRL